MLFKRYKYLELEKTDIGNDEHNYYETVWYIRAYNNKRAYDNRNNTETSKSLDSNGKKKEKKKSRIIVKIIRDSYGNVTRVFVEPKAKKKKEKRSCRYGSSGISVIACNGMMVSRKVMIFTVGF